LVDCLSCEVVVVGGGPAGIAAAVHAAEAGRRVLLLDASPRPGGQVWRHLDRPPRAARPWLARLHDAGAQVLPEASVVDAPSPRTLLVERSTGVALVRHTALVLATGARELFLPFPGWTLPGVIGAGAAQALRGSGARFGGRRVLVAGSGPLLLAAAAALQKAGARVVAVVEQAPLARLAAFAAALLRRPAKVAEALGYGAMLRGVPLHAGAWVTGATGRDRVEEVQVTTGGRRRTVACDVLACGFGLVPNLELPRLLGCECSADSVCTDAELRTSVAGVFAAGELCGIGGVDQALATGAVAGLAAARAALPAALLRRHRNERAFGNRLRRAFALRDELRALAQPGTVVCRCEDVTLERIVANGPDGWRPATACRELKLHTRLGMGACQARTCGAALRFLFGWEPDTIRPPLLPTTLGSLCAALDERPADAPGESRALEDPR
jgi:NADPH-dependent 2,4-dienoyl-CoA reductase/sulfur reductase-like enzyme